MKKIIIYSDCDFFAGCENMIPILLNNSNSMPEYSFHFVFRNSSDYSSELKKRVLDHSLFSPLNLWKFSYYSDSRFRRGVSLLLNNLLKPFIFFQNYLVIFNEFKKHNAYMCHINNGGYPGAFSARIASIAAKKLNMKVSMFVNNTAITPKESFLRFLGYPLDAIVSSNIDIFVNASEVASNQLKEVFQEFRYKGEFKVIPNAIDLNRFKPFLIENIVDKSKLDKVTFGIVGIHEPRKGHKILFESIKEITTKNPEYKGKFHLIVEGKGPHTSLLKNYVEDNNLFDYIEFTGVAEDISDIYQKIDVFILPSLENEDLPNVISEALYFGLPIIGSNIAGIPSQILDQENGFLVKPNDFLGVSKKMIFFIQNQHKIKEMGLKSRLIFDERFTISSVLPMYKDLFQ